LRVFQCAFDEVTDQACLAVHGDAVPVCSTDRDSEEGTAHALTEFIIPAPCVHRVAADEVDDSFHLAIIESTAEHVGIVAGEDTGPDSHDRARCAMRSDKDSSLLGNLAGDIRIDFVEAIDDDGHVEVNVVIVEACTHSLIDSGGG